MKEVKYFRYSDFGPITLNTGRMGSGLTLSAVIRLVKSQLGENPPKIVSNAHLNGLDFSLPDSDRVEEYLNSPHLLLFDSGYQYFSPGRTATREQIREYNVWEEFFKSLHSSKSKAIFTTSIGFEALSPTIRRLVSDAVLVRSNFCRNRKLELYHYKVDPTSLKTNRYQPTLVPISRCTVKRANRYWWIYDTFEIPDADSLIGLKGVSGE